MRKRGDLVSGLVYLAIGAAGMTFAAVGRRGYDVKPFAPSIIVINLAALIWMFFRWRRDRQHKTWRVLGRCLKCGYDLRESRDRCPECGTVYTKD
jgi:hypothetical protein